MSSPDPMEEKPPAYLRAGLSLREMEVLHYISYGQTNPVIARRLHVSENTVKSHVRKLFRKLNVDDRAHAVRRGFELGLITDRPPARASHVRPRPETSLAEVRRQTNPGAQLVAALQSLGWTHPTLR